MSPHLLMAESWINLLLMPHYSISIKKKHRANVAVSSGLCTLMHMLLNNKKQG